MIKNLEDFQVYQLAIQLGEDVWAIVDKWNYFQKDTVGKQLVRAADSISANLSEGFGRYHYKETKHFFYYSRGSLFETKTWLTKAKHRNLISSDQSELLMQQIKNINVKINNYIQTLKY
jgi:four helix bundle protein